MLTLVSDGEDDLDDKKDHIGKYDNEEVMMNCSMKIMAR